MKAQANERGELRGRQRRSTDSKERPRSGGAALNVVGITVIRDDAERSTRDRRQPQRHERGRLEAAPEPLGGPDISGPQSALSSSQPCTSSTAGPSPRRHACTAPNTNGGRPRPD